MNIFLEEHQNVLSNLRLKNVEFLLIGGYAVIFHGYPRSTGDMDIWVRPSNENKALLINALRDSGYDPDNLSELNKVDFVKHFAFSLGIEPQKIEFINYVNLVSFDEAFQNKVLFDFEGLIVPFINVRELILSKINTGRKKDEADVEELQRILNYKGK
ncbi:MAG: nucleotidyltransferase [Saprospiraceae bacterium]